MVLVDRSVSDSDDDINIQPLELDQLQRRLDDSNDSSHDVDVASGNRFFSAVYGMGLKRRREGGNRKFIAKMAWKNAIMKARNMGDPWEKFHLESYKSEKAYRHRYNSLKQKWVVDEVQIKMEEAPFNHGAMRECFRMKKLSNFAKNDDWKRAHNYVAKRYMEHVNRNTYFDDVQLQMDAKLWGEEYNRHNPPKKVDIFQMAILELIEREGSPLYHVEHFIEGQYIKYNSNSGFVHSEAIRMTPQAFSHFTFERSGHELIVVDIQGVGDLYTDPQIHTAVGDDYGDGNLGTRGMALFFHSHVCNSICKSLGLTPFDLATTEEDDLKTVASAQMSCKTRVRGTEEVVLLPSIEEMEHMPVYLRMRSLSSGYLSGDDIRARVHHDSVCSVDSVDSFDEGMHTSESEDSAVSSAKRSNLFSRSPRQRLYSSSECESCTEEKDKFAELVKRKSRPSHVQGEIDHRLELSGKCRTGRSVLGQIHLDLAKYHELNRFVEESEMYDQKAALFHVEQAAKCSVLEAIITMARLHMDLPHDILPDITLNENECNKSVGFSYLEMAAGAGDRASMIQVAKALDTGIGLPSDRSKDWREAVHWYERAVKMDSADEEGNFDGTMDDPTYQLVARVAAMHFAGEHHLEKDPNKSGEMFNWAAELATEAMKGKLASKYYMLAEEAWAECPEE